jgi:hypothetical protein
MNVSFSLKVDELQWREELCNITGVTVISNSCQCMVAAAIPVLEPYLHSIKIPIPVIMAPKYKEHEHAPA